MNLTGLTFGCDNRSYLLNLQSTSLEGYCKMGGQLYSGMIHNFFREFLLSCLQFGAEKEIKNMHEATAYSIRNA